MRGKLRLLWPVLAIITVGAAIGTGGYTFIYAKGSSYLTNDPSACANCHVMRAEYDGWIKSSHHDVAVCNDCHTPHDLVGKYTLRGDETVWQDGPLTTAVKAARRAAAPVKPRAKAVAKPVKAAAKRVKATQPAVKVKAAAKAAKAAVKAPAKAPRRAVAPVEQPAAAA